jgi:tripartite-type tricarboxylate transporter receptor subunit TctC
MPWARTLLIAFLFVGNANAQGDYPTRPVKVVVPSPPGGGTDILARVLAQHFSKAFGQPFVVRTSPARAT